jgi:hypothetical protein
MLMSIEKGRAMRIAIRETYKVLTIKGRKPNSPLNGLHSDKDSSDQRFFSFITGKDEKNNEKQMMRSSRTVKTAMPGIMHLTALSLIDLILLIFAIVISSVQK